VRFVSTSKIPSEFVQPALQFTDALEEIRVHHALLPSILVDSEPSPPGVEGTARPSPI